MARAGAQYREASALPVVVGPANGHNPTRTEPQPHHDNVRRPDPAICRQVPPERGPARPRPICRSAPSPCRFAALHAPTDSAAATATGVRANLLRGRVPIGPFRATSGPERPAATRRVDPSLTRVLDPGLVENLQRLPCGHTPDHNSARASCRDCVHTRRERAPERTGNLCAVARLRRLADELTEPTSESAVVGVREVEPSARVPCGALVAVGRDATCVGDHPREVEQVPGHEGRVPVGEVVLGPP